MINGNDIALHNADFGDFIKTLDHCKGDVFMETADGDVLFNEINTIPGFTAISMYPKLMGECGIPYSELITRLIMAEAE